MYEEILEDVENIISLKTASNKAKTRMIVELIMSHGEIKEKPAPRVETPSVAVEKPKRKYRKKGQAILGRKKITQEEIDKIATTLRTVKDIAPNRKIKLISNLVSRTEKAITNFFMRVRNEDPVLTKKYDIRELRNLLLNKDVSVQPSLKGLKKKRKPYQRTLQTEIDTCYKERKMGTSYKNIAKLLNTSENRVRHIIEKIGKGIFVPSSKKNKREDVEVGQDTKMPRKFSYQG